MRWHCTMICQNLFTASGVKRRCSQLALRHDPPAPLLAGGEVAQLLHVHLGLAVRAVGAESAARLEHLRRGTKKIRAAKKATLGDSRRTSANLGESRRVSGESRLASTALHPRQRTDTVTMPISPPVVGITCSQPEV